MDLGSRVNITMDRIWYGDSPLRRAAVVIFELQKDAQDLVCRSVTWPDPIFLPFRPR